MIILKSPLEIEKMRRSCRMVAEILKIVKAVVKPGITTCSLDEIAERETVRRGALPAFKGYSGYKFALCCSVNDQVVHGMPNKRELCDGDILSLDFGVLYEGFYGDAAITLPVGSVAQSSQKLIDVTEQSLYKAIEYAVPGGHLSDISNGVQEYVESRGYSVVRDFVGHGIGRSLHENPQIPNYGKPGRGPKLKPGMVLAIEPMINEKGFAVKVLADGWTAVTCDGGLSAHFEHTVAITENGPDILTKFD
ncbi:type I methionyl aminopeptidase [Geobacter pelophilus]|uniref:Methionine aminopeptidase n=1 Tax=Geoanaerobacter pelophilus TaxID=60036 RepID=A0AAW4L6K0_9BACT|nr:type I methionyl aminopeptidase [Geoanaerobacter pelophilus]